MKTDLEREPQTPAPAPDYPASPLSRISDLALDHRWLVLLGLVVLLVAGVTAMLRLPIEAFPDLTNNQVVVLTEVPAMAPTEVEQRVTYPIETALMGLPRTEGVRSMSKLGLSMVTVIFEDSVSPYLARQVVNERIQEARSRLPDNVEPSLGPLATAFGEVYQYTLHGRGWSAMDLKTLHDWQVKLQLRAVRGVNEVNTWGGETRQYAVEVDPVALRRYGLTLRQVYSRLQENNENFGGGFVEHAGEQYTVRGLGRARSMEDIGSIVLLARAGTPVTVRDVATVAVRPAPRQGAVLRDAKGETVSGMVIMLKGENGRTVIDRVKTRLASLRLPEGVRLVPFYDQSEVINRTLGTVRRNLLEAGLLVMVVLLLFLGNVRAALIVAAVIPLSMLFGFLGMAAFGVSANLMSLGAIDFGMIVDGAVVMAESAVRRMQDRHAVPPLERVRLAAREVARPITFAVAIIIAVYLPILTLEGLEGRMFRPMAITVCCALFGSLVLALTAVPVALSYALRRSPKPHREPWFRKLQAAYARSLDAALRHPWAATASGLALIALGVVALLAVGTEFMPRLDEGSLLITTRKLPGISLTDSIRASQRVEEVLVGFPEVSGVVTKLGRPDLATEAMGIYEADVYVLLHPRDRWRARSRDELVERMAAALGEVPGVALNFTQPMAMRLDEVVSGIKADVAVKIFGESESTLQQLAERARRQLASVPGAADVQVETASGVGELHVEVDRPALARYGLNVTDVQELVDAATGGLPATEVVEGQRRFAVAVRLPSALRRDPDSLGQLLLSAPAGELVPLRQVARIQLATGAERILRENGQRLVVVQCNVRGTDLGSFVSAAQERVERELRLPAGYSVEWGGQFENQARATRRLALVVPLSVALIFGLLYATFASVRQALLILLNVPFALVGGAAALWLRGLNLNLSASVGFIALFGVAVLNGIVLVSSVNALRRNGHPVRDAVREGASLRLRPVLMTALVASLGFAPMAFSTAPGSEVQRPLATVVMGGLVTATLLTLYLLPVLYSRLEQPRSPSA